MPFQITLGEAFGKAPQRQFGLGRDHDAGSVLVQPMHNAGPLFAADARQVIPCMGQKRIDQRAILIARGGMHHQARGFVEHDQIRILMQYCQRNILRLRQGGDGGRDFKRVKRTGADGLGRFLQTLAVAAGMARDNQGLDAGAGERTYRLSKEAIGAHAGRFNGRAEFVAFSVQKGGFPCGFSRFWSLEWVC